MDGRDRHNSGDAPGRVVWEAAAGGFSFPVAPSQIDRMLAAAHALSLDILANTATAPVIDAATCAEWMAVDFARDRRAFTRPDRRSPGRDRRRNANSGE
ncbi:MAG: hypothetical protein U0232_25735 [Thermomicrobiales bacterium]